MPEQLDLFARRGLRRPGKGKIKKKPARRGRKAPRKTKPKKKKAAKISANPAFKRGFLAGYAAASKR